MPEDRERFFMPAQFVQHQGAEIVNRRFVTQYGGARKILQRLFRPLHLLQCHAAMQMRLVEVGLERDGPVQGGQRFGEAAAAQIAKAEISLEGGIVRRQHADALQDWHRLLRHVGVQRQQPELVSDLRVFGLAPQNGAIGFLRFGEAALGMQSEGLFEHTLAAFLSGGDTRRSSTVKERQGKAAFRSQVPMLRAAGRGCSAMVERQLAKVKIVHFQTC